MIYAQAYVNSGTTEKRKVLYRAVSARTLEAQPQEMLNLRVRDALTFFADPMQQIGFGTVMSGERVMSPSVPRPDVSRDTIASDRKFLAENILRYWWQLSLQCPRSATTAITEIQD